ncbi:MAG: PAS domain S-box protein, partial [Spirochaetota bacterium]|nr:PAS domain S-box protein [Spirochaetota bacterium]
MSDSSNNKYKKTIIVFMAILIVFLVIVDFLIITHQENTLMATISHHANHEAELMGTALRERILKNDYDKIKNFITNWGKEQADIVKIVVSSAGGFEIAKYQRTAKAEHSLAIHKYAYQNDLLLLKLAIELDLTKEKDRLFNLAVQLIAGSVIFTIGLGFALWTTIDKMAIRPLDREIAMRTELARAQREAYLSLEQERNLFMSGPTVIIKRRFAENMPVEYISANIKDITGYSSDEMISGELDFTTIVPEEDRLQLMEEMSQSLDSDLDSYATNPWRIRHKSGHIIWFVGHINFLKNKNGDITHSLGYLVDITRQKQAEENIKKINLALKALTRCRQVLLHANNENELLNDICRVLVEEIGYQLAWIGYAEEDERKTVRPVAFYETKPGYVESIFVSWREDQHGKGPTGMAVRLGETQFVRDIHQDATFDPWRSKGLDYGFNSVVGIPIKLGDYILGAITVYSKDINAFDPDEIKILEDLTADIAYGIATIRTQKERTLAQTELHESQKMLQLVLDSIPVRVFWKDFYSIYMGCNRLFASDAGLSHPDEVVGKTDLDLAWGNQPEAQQFRMDDRDIIQSGRAKLSVEEQQHKADGTIIWVEKSKIPLTDDQGKVIGVLGTYNDITER